MTRTAVISYRIVLHNDVKRYGGINFNIIGCTKQTHPCFKKQQQLQQDV